MPKLVMIENLPMKILKLTLLIVLVSASTILSADVQVTPITLEAAKEQGRAKSRFLKETKAPAKTTDAIPKANVAYFQKSVMPILKKSCINCHGPKKSEGRFRIDQLNPDLLTGPDVERWREVYNAVSNSEMPPADEPGLSLIHISEPTRPY